MNAVWAVTPLANIVLLARELFDHRVTPILAVLTLASTSVMPGWLAVAARVFGTDAVLYGSAATWADLARRPEARRSLPDWTQGVVRWPGCFRCTCCSAACAPIRRLDCSGPTRHECGCVGPVIRLLARCGGMVAAD